MALVMTRSPALVFALVAMGCSAPIRSWSFPTRVFAPSAPHRTRARSLHPSPHATPAVALVERSLHERGLRFGTDGSVGALFGYARDNGRSVAPAEARAGDVVFFDLGDGCAGHVGLVEGADGDGRVAFREARDGQIRHSYADATTPSVRRDEAGRILNTFLRPKRPDDPPQTRYFAGEMLCAVLRVRR
jgi:hypothetical protein